MNPSVQGSRSHVVLSILVRDGDIDEDAELLNGEGVCAGRGEVEVRARVLLATTLP